MENNAITQPALPYEEPTSVIPGADILIATADEIFLANARESVALPHRAWHASSVLEAADKLAAQPCAVIVLDVALGQSRLREIVAKLRGQFPDLACIIAGEQKDEPEAASLLVSGEIQGFIFKHHTARQLAKILPLGIDRHFRLKEEAARTAGGSGKRAPVAMAIGFAAMAAIALGAWLALRGGAEKPAAKSVPATVVATRPKAAPTPAESFDQAAAIERELSRAEAALLANDPITAAAVLENVKALSPNHPRVAFLNAQLARELERSAAERKAAANAEQTRQQLAELMKREQEREEQEYLASQQRLEAERQKAAAELARAEAVAAEQARAAAAEAQKAPPPETREQLRAQRQLELMETPEVVNAAKVARQTQPQYPERAQREGVEGYVDVSFTVATTGAVKDVIVADAQPKGYFEEASLRAVKKWKFEPKRIDGDLYEQRMTVHLTYKLAR